MIVLLEIFQFLRNIITRKTRGKKKDGKRNTFIFIIRKKPTFTFFEIIRGIVRDMTRSLYLGIIWEFLKCSFGFRAECHRKALIYSVTEQLCPHMGKM